MSENKVSSLKLTVSLRPRRQQGLDITVIICLAGIGLLSSIQPALAHHAIDGKTPSNFLEGFISGLAHPIIGLDHLAFTIAIGLLAVGQVRGILLPAGFVLAAMAGTGMHLLKLDLPAAEMAIASSAILFGFMLLIQRRPNFTLLAVLAAFAGLFHGYAYGESIVGAQMTPLIAYLLGFSFIQYAVALLALQIGNLVARKFARKTIQPLPLAGLVICSIGIVFLTSAIGIF